jgi:recombinational DNA repair ATPase RecF
VAAHRECALHRAGRARVDARCNLISGPNASGKTTLLESIFLLGRGRSFRTPKLESLIRAQCAELRVVGKAVSGQRTLTLGVEATREALRARWMDVQSPRTRTWPWRCPCSRSIPKFIV